MNLSDIFAEPCDLLKGALPLGLLPLRKLQLKGLSPVMWSTNNKNPLKRLKGRKKELSEMAENTLD